MHQLPPDIAGGSWDDGNDGIGGQGDTGIAGRRRSPAWGSAPAVSVTEVSVEGTRQQGSHRIVHTLAVVGFFG
jgi:hypothetical protein